MKKLPFSEKQAIDKSGIISPWRMRLHEVIFESDTPAGKAFDSILLVFILLSVLTVILDSVSMFRSRYGFVLTALEWFFTITFTIEFIARIVTIGKPLRYVFSFYGIVDLSSIVPTYLSLVLPGTKFLLVIRALRLIRIFRIFKLTRYLSEGEVLMSALRQSKYKITVFLGTVGTLVIIMGTLMYITEGEQNGFTSIPRSIYWAIVTLTTVGYGDIAPKTVLGQALASLIMIMGYGIIAVPTGIVTAELAGIRHKSAVTAQSCPQCSRQGHDPDASHCKYCGGKLSAFTPARSLLMICLFFQGISGGIH